jgi:hypothetical protein
MNGATKGIKTREALFFLGFFAAWSIFQALILPRFGVKT